MKGVSYQFETISQKRTIIMGFAMALVVFFHSSIDVSKVPVLGFLKHTGDVGVDIFLLVSGIGIYFSLQKNPNYKEYLYRRISRIIPAYLIVEGLWFGLHDLVLGGGDLWAFVKDVTSISFWFEGKLTTWYLALPMVLQVATPFYLNIWKKHTHFDALTIAVVFGVGILIRMIPRLDHVLDHLLVAIFRTPAYLVGLSFGKLVYEKKTCYIRAVRLFLMSVGSLLIVAAAYGYFPFYIPWAFKYIAYLPLAIVCTMMLAKLPDFSILHFMGTHSLEIYLLHEKILWLFSAVIYKIMSEFRFVLLLNGIVIFTTFVGAIILKKLIAFLLHTKGKH